MSKLIHDMNNLLAIIQPYLEMAMESCDDCPKQKFCDKYQNLGKVLDASDRMRKRLIDACDYEAKKKKAQKELDIVIHDSDNVDDYIG